MRHARRARGLPPHRASSGSSTGARSGSTASRPTTRSPRSPGSACRSTSTPRASSPARCTAPPTPSSTASSRRILRFGIPYGPRARPATVIAAFVRKALAGEPLTLAGDGMQTRRFVYVEDLADGVVRALEPRAAGPRLQPRRHGDRDDQAGRRDGPATRSPRPGIVHTPGRNGDFAGAEISSDRAGRELGWAARTNLERGRRRLPRLAARERGARARPRRAPSEPRRCARASAACAIGRLLRAARDRDRLLDRRRLRPRRGRSCTSSRSRASPARRWR